MYAELTQPRLQESRLHAGTLVAGAARRRQRAMALDERYPVAGTALTTSLWIDAENASPGHRVGIDNAGYWGIPVTPSATFYAKTSGAAGVPLTISIEGVDGKSVYAQAEGCRIDGQWKRYSVSLATGANVKPTADARLVLATESRARCGSTWCRCSRRPTRIGRTATGPT
ncbi:hypothetical protein [Roseateles sp. LYH14W]|uniref:CBM6 domain-containing protein n=1 Tax=Pelomonas parva TaxID=3299032 RepID=A0ABW7F8M1_9BURK